MTRQTTVTAVGLLIVVVVLVAVGRIVTAPEPFAPLVQEIVQTPQTYDGEHVDKLVALGPDGVPAIGSALLADGGFPIVFVHALERIGDERGAKPILSFVAAQAPYSDSDRSWLTASTILALRGVGSTAACEPLGTILRDETAHPRVRLASASTCARLCAGDSRAEAQTFILDMYEDRRRYLAEPNDGVTPNELYSALIDVDNDESLAILLNLVEVGAPPYIIEPVISYLSLKNDETVTDTLQRALDDSGAYELPVRLALAQAILDTGRPPTESLRTRIDELVDEARPDLYGQEIANEAQRLRVRAAEL